MVRLRKIRGSVLLPCADASQLRTGSFRGPDWHTQFPARPSGLLRHLPLFFFFSSAFAVLMPFAAADLNAVECYLHARTLRSRREQNGTLDGCQYLLNFMGTDGYLLAPSN